MEIIGVILMIVFALISASDKKKKAAQKAERQRMGADQVVRPINAAPKPAGQMSMAERQARMDELRQKKAERAARDADVPVMPSNAEASFESSLSQLKQLLNVAAQATPAEGESMLTDADCAGGSMPHDHAEGGSALADEECAGGSMPHRHTQGVSRAAQNRRLEELDHRREAEEADRLFPRTIDARAMRRAVVMAEVLGKPRALQGKRRVA